jgi:hypothetical protein
MWTALEAYKPKRRYTKAWRVMCKERTYDAAWAAYCAAPAGSAAARAAISAAWAAEADDYAQRAIDAIREVQP